MKCKGFTLIELLVVVAIIVILIAILLPSLGRAKAQAQSAACLSNLRSIGLGCHIYAAENSSYLPLALQWQPRVFDDPLWGATCWLASVYQYATGSEFPNPIESNLEFQISRVFVCPVKNDDTWVYKGISLSNYLYPRNYGDMVNYAPDPANMPYYKPRKIINCPVADRAVLVKDGIATSPPSPGWNVFEILFDSTKQYNTYGFSWRHNGEDNAAFVDGHAETLSNVRKIDNARDFYVRYNGIVADDGDLYWW